MSTHLEPLYKNTKNYTFLSKRPRLRHLAQIRTLKVLPPISVFIFIKFGFHTLFLWFIDLLTLLPDTVPFPHISQILAIVLSSKKLYKKINSPARVRTTDPVVNSHLLCLLSYRGIFQKIGCAWVYIKHKTMSIQEVNNYQFFLLKLVPLAHHNVHVE